MLECMYAVRALIGINIESDLAVTSLLLFHYRTLYGQLIYATSYIMQ